MKKLNTMWNNRNPKSTGKNSAAHGKGHRVASLLLALMVLGLFSIPALAAETPLPEELPLPDSSVVSIAAETPNSGTPEEGTPSPSSGDNSSSSGSGASPVSGPGEGPEAESGGQPVQDPALPPEAPSSVGGSISGTMWMDDNPRDGIWDAGETGIPGLAVSLYKADDLTTAIESATTDEDGLYTFEGLAAGDYVVSIVRQTVDGIEYLIPMKMLQAGADNKFDYTAATTPSSAVSESMSIVDETTVITDIDAGMRPKPAIMLFATDVNTLAALQAAINAAPTNGTLHEIRVTANIAGVNGLTIAAGKNIRIYSDSAVQLQYTGNGARHFTVASGATLTLAGNLTLLSTHDFTTTTYGGGGITNNGTLRMEGNATITHTCTPGTISLARSVQNTGTFIMDGGKIINGVTGRLSDGSAVVNTGTFTMNAGTISGFVSSTNGQGAVRSSGIFNMSGGTISGCSMTYDTYGLKFGSAVNIGGSGSTFNMSGTASITGNTANANTYTQGGGVYIGAGATMNMSGGSITNNKTSTCGGGIYLNKTGCLNMTGGSITGNEAYLAYPWQGGMLGCGAGIYTEDFDYGNPANTSKYANISISGSATVANNILTMPVYLSNAPDNWAEFNDPAIRGSLGTFDGKLLNNKEINFHNPNYSVQYKPNNGNAELDYFQATSIPVGGTGTATLVTQTTAGFTPPTANPTYVFRGWNSAANGGGTWYAPGDIVPISPTDTRVFYAQWGPPTADVTVSKTITGKMADMTRTFTFTATIWDSTNSLAANGSFPYSVNTGTTSVNGGAPTSSGTLVLNGSGQATFTLGHGQSITIEGVSSSGHIQIAEQTDSHYYTSHAASGTGYTFSKASGDTNPGDTEKQAMGTANLTVAYTNEKIYVVPTGVSSGGHAGALLGPVATLMALAAWFITQWLYRRLGVR